VELDVTVQLQAQAWKQRLRPYCKIVRDTCGATLEDTKLASQRCRFEIAVVLADDAFIKTLNHTYRGKNKPTNVLSFPADEHIERRIKSLTKGQKEYALGDIVLALETIERECEEQQKSLRHHVLHLLVHGTLHLLGYDHEDDKQASQMEKKEIKILENLNVKNPYLS
jgi:probable rRNA maturation factor